MQLVMIVLLIAAGLAPHHSARADYTQGCTDPAYLANIENAFENFAASGKRALVQTAQAYTLSLENSANIYQIIANLRRHIQYSAQFEPIETVERKIERMFEHAEQLTREQLIAGDVIDGFSDENHAISIARAWLAYRQDQKEQAFKALLDALGPEQSILISSYGPDFDLVRQIYHDGHKQPVLEYITKTEKFWIGQRADKLRNVWRKMIAADCAVQFNSMDLVNAVELGLERSSMHE